MAVKSFALQLIYFFHNSSVKIVDINIILLIILRENWRLWWKCQAIGKVRVAKRKRSSSFCIFQVKNKVLCWELKQKPRTWNVVLEISWAENLCLRCPALTLTEHATYMMSTNNEIPKMPRMKGLLNLVSSRLATTQWWTIQAQTVILLLE